MKADSLSFLLEQFLQLSEAMRPGYRNSLGNTSPDWKQVLSELGQPLPPLLEEIYQRCQGTSRSIQNQILFDFIPGFRLLSIGELFVETQKLRTWTTGECDGVLFPFLADYSFGYLGILAKENNSFPIVLYTPEEGLTTLHESQEKLLETLIAFYEQSVYFLDEDGFLDYDYDLEGVVGHTCNPTISFWIDSL